MFLISLQELGYRYTMLCLALFISTGLPAVPIYSPGKAEPNSASPSESPRETTATENTNKCPGRKCLELFTPVLTVYYVNTIFWNVGFGVVIVFLYDHVTTLALGTTASSGLAMTLLGGGQLLASIVMSLLHAKFTINKYLVHIVAASLLSLCAFIMGFIHNIPVLIILSAAFGMSAGLIISNIGSFVYHLLGDTNHSLVYTFTGFSSGIGALAGPPLAAALDNYLGWSYFFTSACGSFLSLIVMVGLLLTRRDTWQPADRKVSAHH